MANQPSYHNCPYCSQLVLDGDPYCSKCGGPQVFKPKGGGVALNLDPWLITDYIYQVALSLALQASRA